MQSFDMDVTCLFGPGASFFRPPRVFRRLATSALLISTSVLTSVCDALGAIAPLCLSLLQVKTKLHLQPPFSSCCCSIYGL